MSRLPCAVRSSRRCSDQHDTFSGVGILADPVSAGLRAGDLVSRSSRSSTRLGRPALRAARRVQVSENSFCCTDSFARSFVPHRRVVSSTSDLARASVPRVSGELSASCSCCGRALVCESGALYRVCAEDARQSVVSSGVIILIAIRGNTDTKLLRRYCCRESGTGTVCTRGARRNES